MVFLALSVPAPLKFSSATKDTVFRWTLAERYGFSFDLASVQAHRHPTRAAANSER
jgi:hypothetical protein